MASPINNFELRSVESDEEMDVELKYTRKWLKICGIILLLSGAVAFIIAAWFATKKRHEKPFVYYMVLLAFYQAMAALYAFNFSCLPSVRKRSHILFAKVVLCITAITLMLSILGAVDLMMPIGVKWVAIGVSSAVLSILCLGFFYCVSLA